MTGTVVDAMYLTLTAFRYDGHSGKCNVFYSNSALYMTDIVVDVMYMTKIARIYDGQSGGCHVFYSNSTYI